jgi:hypothetical protein
MLHGLALFSYKNGFKFSADAGAPLAEMFSGLETATSYMGAFGFEGDTNADSHVTAFWIRNGWIGLFDPNLGEYLFPDRGSIEKWLPAHLCADHSKGDKLQYGLMHDGWYVALFV